MLRAATPGRRGLEPGERSSLRGLSRCRAAPLYLGWRVCAPSAGRASVCGSGPSLFLECLWVGVSAYGVAVSLHSPWLLWAGVFLRCQLRRAGRPSPRSSRPMLNLVPAAFRDPSLLSASSGVSLPRSSNGFGRACFSPAAPAAGRGAAVWAGGGRCLTRKGAEWGRAWLHSNPGRRPGHAGPQLLPQVGQQVPGGGVGGARVSGPLCFFLSFPPLLPGSRLAL